MENSKHTSGPWKMNGHHLGTIYPQPFRVETIEPNICEMASSLPPDEVTANARLIAAAPEMLRSLEQVRAWLMSGIGIDVDFPVQWIDAAIAKAEGK